MEKAEFAMEHSLENSPYISNVNCNTQYLVRFIGSVLTELTLDHLFDDHCTNVTYREKR